MATFAKSLLSRLPLPQVRASIVRAVLAMGEAKGVARAELLHATGLTEEDVAELDQVVPGVLVLRLYAFLQDRFPQDALGLDAAAIAPSSTFGVLGYALRNAPTLGDGLDMTRRFISLTSSHARMDREDTEDAVAITFRHHPLAIHARHPLELGLAFALRALGVEPGDRVLSSLEFQHRPTAEMARYVEYFGVEPTFESSRTRFVIPRAHLGRPRAGADPALHDYLEALLRGTRPFSPLPDEALGAALATCVDRCDYRVEALADHAGMTPRTLHRRLAALGTTPRELLAQTRFSNAEALLADRSLPIIDVAFLAGYADERAFVRAFKRWSGTTPAAFRRERGVVARFDEAARPL